MPLTYLKSLQNYNEGVAHADQSKVVEMGCSMRTVSIFMCERDTILRQETASLYKTSFTTTRNPVGGLDCNIQYIFITIMILHILFNCLLASVVRPKIELFGPNASQYILEEGGSVNLTCKIIEGFPPPQLSWFKNGDLLSEDANTALLLTNVTDRDEGGNTCTAQNAGGYFNVSINVTMKSKFIKLILNISTTKSITSLFC